MINYIIHFDWFYRLLTLKLQWVFLDNWIYVLVDLNQNFDFEKYHLLLWKLLASNTKFFFKPAVQVKTCKKVISHYLIEFSWLFGKLPVFEMFSGQASTLRYAHWLAIGAPLADHLELIERARVSAFDVFALKQEPITRWLGILSSMHRCQTPPEKRKEGAGSDCAYRNWGCCSSSNWGSFPAFSDSTIRKQSNVLRVSDIGFGPERAASIPIG